MVECLINVVVDEVEAKLLLNVRFTVLSNELTRNFSAVLWVLKQVTMRSSSSKRKN